MALTKKIQIDGQDVVFRASAAIPRIYRLKFGRDIFKDLMELEKSMKKNDEDKSNLDIGSLELFENIAYVMAKHGEINLCQIVQKNGWIISQLFQFIKFYLS